MKYSNQTEMQYYERAIEYYGRIGDTSNLNYFVNKYAKFVGKNSISLTDEELTNAEKILKEFIK